MTSSMLTGERRWASARRGGMTVLGKVAVPKPINLPSQRLENHGLDPTVEIVPKGTHSWGSKSSASSNAWGSSSLSPKTDGGTGSPSYFSGRPSSGGTGTRPSTAGSERAQDPTTNAWGSGSRPSSSSGALTSNQTSQTALRPCSAETRPGSSQLSRFAEPLTDNSIAWSGNGTSEKLGMASSKHDGFSLSSGDFPTLGSEKDNPGKNADFQDHGSHGCPGSSSKVASGKELPGDSSGAWRKENSLYAEDRTRSNVEKWHADHPPYPTPNIPPQHYDAWHGPSVNNHPGGGWYRGPPGGPPFGSPVPPGGFPMEPFPYYSPQMPPPALANPQPVPPPGTGPRGPHPKNGDMYRPHMHDPYIRPGMPLRPGFYPGPVPYDGYYGPPMGYCNSSERDVPFMGMAMGPGGYNRYASQSVPDPGNSHGRTSGYGPSKMMVSEQMEAVHPQDSRGPYKVLLKQHDSWEGKDEERKWDDATKDNASYSIKGEHPRKSSWENGWEADDKRNDEMDARRMRVGGGSSCEAVDNRTVHLKMKSPETVGSLNASDESSLKKFEHAASTFPEASADPKDSSLIQKIEGLNAKARASDVTQDVKSASSREEQKNKFQVGDVTVCHSTIEVANASLSHEKDYGSGIINTIPHEDLFAARDKNLESTVVTGSATLRRSTHSRADHHGRGRFNAQEADGWRKKTHLVEPENTASTVHIETYSVSHAPDHDSMEAAQNSESRTSGKTDGEAILPVSEPNDSQHAKMIELAKKLKQREREEEERTREQRAKALAKLEELNRRTQAMESTQKLETVPATAIQSRLEFVTTVPPTLSASKSGASGTPLVFVTNKVANNREKLESVTVGHEESRIAAPQTVFAGKSRASGSAPGSSHSVVAQSSENSDNRAEKSVGVASNVSPGTPKTASNESVVVHDQSKPFQQDGSNDAAAQYSNTSRGHESNTSKQKRIGYRQKLNSIVEKNSNEKLIPSAVTEAPRGYIDATTNITMSSESVADEITSNSETDLSVYLSVPTESSAHHRKKNRSGKNKHKVDEVSSAAALPSKETKALDTSESVKSKTSEALLDHSSFQYPTSLNDADQSLELRSSLPNEEGHIKSNNQWKSQHPRRMTRNSQGNKSADRNHSSDAVIWAPVQTKIKVSDEANRNVSVESVLQSNKSDQLVQNNPRNKRAEMERYIPKPVAKEPYHEGSSHQAIAPSSNQIASDEIVESSEPGTMGAESTQTTSAAVGKVGSTMESRNGDVRQNRPGRVQGSWRQRGAAESSTNPSRSSQISMEDYHQITDESSLKEKPRHSDEWNASDGWNMPENPDTAVVPVFKDQGTGARGKRHPHKGQKGMGHNHNPDEMQTRDPEKVHTQSTAPEVHQTDAFLVAKVNHAVGDRLTSHWQPKAQALPATNQRGSQPNSSVDIGPEGGRGNRKDAIHQDMGPLLPQPDKDQSLSQKRFQEAHDIRRHQEPKRERRTGGQRGRPVSPVELNSHSNTDVRHEQCMLARLCKNGNTNSRYSREQESCGEWTGKDNKQHNPPAIGARQRHNSQYEYQPVWPNNNNKPNKFELPKDRPQNSNNSRYRERGQNHSLHGGGSFYGRRTGSVEVDGGYE